MSSHASPSPTFTPAPAAQGLDDLLADVHPALAEVERLMQTPYPGQHANITVATEHLVSSGGKRLRPALALLIGESYDMPDPQYIWALAAAVEMLHTATLVHDDLIDGALMRRGIETLNAKWSPAATVLTGDFFFARAAGLAARIDNVRVMRIFSETLMAIVNGEIYQLFAGRSEWPTHEDYYTRMFAKTGSLFAAATQSAAVLCAPDGAKGEEGIAAMRAFGRNFGLAFQIVDDVLDYVGSEEKIGKPAGQDLAMGLVTLPLLHFAERHPNHPGIKAIQNGYHHDPEAVSDLLAAVRASEAVADSMAEARGLIAEAKQLLAKIPAGRPRDVLAHVAEYVVTRDV